MSRHWSQRRFDILCDVDIEQTPTSFHAYAVPDGVNLRPGDRVLMHSAPTVAFGEHVRCQCAATVFRAGVLGRVWARLQGFWELTDLYEVGFDAKDVT